MEETLITFETAKLAKEKGFDIQVLDFWAKGKKPYISQGLEYMSECYTKSNWNNGQGSYPTKAEEVCCSAPTQSLLQKWLREVHNINVYCVPTEIDETKWYNNIASSYKVYTGTYEEALEEGLYQALLLV